VFGFSFGELVVICLVALVFVGPQKLPGLLRTLGEWIRKARNLVSDMRTQSGIDDILRAEGLQGGIHELRTIMRGQHIPGNPSPSSTTDSPSDSTGSGTPEQLSPSPYHQDQYQGIQIDPTKEYPPEGVDAFGALPDDLIGLPPPGQMPDQTPELAAAGGADVFASANAEPVAPAVEAPAEPVAAPQEAAGDPSDPSQPVDKTEAVA